ncbi:hypothetical protein FN846DRAFT_985498 [Sphaerosporella brunnea]|uniref:Uncharacterized protein n=1 Tax=Sphaerosporella brunnea TaxID=1250544 RepID=A0A5J5EUG6_9PEZI|nr:hypothetical protein FN846DRAFT_985498 [Sphaerosporella brunnea]
MRMVALSKSVKTTDTDCSLHPLNFRACSSREHRKRRFSLWRPATTMEYPLHQHLVRENRVSHAARALGCRQNALQKRQVLQAILPEKSMTRAASQLRNDIGVPHCALRDVQCIYGNTVGGGMPYDDVRYMNKRNTRKPNNREREDIACPPWIEEQGKKSQLFAITGITHRHVILQTVRERRLPCIRCGMACFHLDANSASTIQPAVPGS